LLLCDCGFIVVVVWLYSFIVVVVWLYSFIVVVVWLYSFIISFVISSFVCNCLEVIIKWIRNLYNENQLDAQFILCLFHQSTFTCFWHICSPSLGGILYIYTTRTNCTLYIYTHSIPPNNGLQICQKHVEVD